MQTMKSKYSPVLCLEPENTFAGGHFENGGHVYAQVEKKLMRGIPQSIRTCMQKPTSKSVTVFDANRNIQTHTHTDNGEKGLLTSAGPKT